jgi:hypothetical protein
MAFAFKNMRFEPIAVDFAQSVAFFSLETLRVSALAGRFFLLLLAGRRGE